MCEKKNRKISNRLDEKFKDSNYSRVRREPATRASLVYRMRTTRDLRAANARGILLELPRLLLGNFEKHGINVPDIVFRCNFLFVRSLQRGDAVSC